MSVAKAVGFDAAVGQPPFVLDGMGRDAREYGLVADIARKTLCGGVVVCLFEEARAAARQVVLEFAACLVRVVDEVGEA